MKSYAKDISNGTDITARAIGHASSRAIDPIALPREYFDEDERPNVLKKSSTVVAATTSTEVAESLWCEAVTDEGHTYYWNVKTNGNDI